MGNRGTHIPCNFGEVARYYRDGLDVDIAVQTVTPMDKHGYFNFGPLCNFKKAVFERAKIIVVEVVEDMPWCYGGYGECIHISEVDYAIENKTDKIITIPTPQPTDVEKKIVWAFAIGSRKLYDWSDHNPALAMCPVEFTNDP